MQRLTSGVHYYAHMVFKKSEEVPAFSPQEKDFPVEFP